MIIDFYIILLSEKYIFSTYINKFIKLYLIFKISIYINNKNIRNYYNFHKIFLKLIHDYLIKHSCFT